MTKHLNDILKQARDRISGKDQFAGSHKSKTEKLSLGKNPGVDYSPKAGDEQEFVSSHEVEKHEYPYGNEKLFTGEVVKYSLPGEPNHGKTLEKGKSEEFPSVKEEAEQIDEAKAAAIGKLKPGEKVVLNWNKKPGQKDNKPKSQPKLTPIGIGKLKPGERVILNWGKKLDEARMTQKKKEMLIRKGMAHDPKAGESIIKYGKEQKAFDSAKKEINKLKARNEETEIVDEALIGKQKNIDVKPPFGKLTSADFKSLQKKKKEAEDKKCSMTEAGKWCPMHEYADCKKMSKLNESVPGRAEAAETISDLKKHSSAVVRSHAKKAEKLFDDDPEQSHYHLKQAVNAASSSKKTVKEEVQYIDEVLTKKDPASKWIHDFVHSDNPKFAGKSKKERQRMALGAYYSKVREETEVQEEAEDLDEMARKVSDAATNAFLAKKTFKSKNTKSTGDELHLHGNKIAYHKDGKIHATMAGWATKTTKERLNSLSSAVGGKKFHTKGGKHYYGDKEIASDDHVVIHEGAIGAVQPLIGGDDAEHHRDELAMAKTELRALANKAMDLVMSMSDEMHIEPWIQSKIAKAKGMISDIHDHLSYGDHKKPEVGEADTPITLPNMSVDVNTGQNV